MLAIQARCICQSTIGSNTSSSCMKYSILTAVSRMLSKDEAGVYVGGPRLLRAMEAAGWLKASVARPELTLYDLRKLDDCCDRLSSGEFPETPTLDHAAKEVSRWRLPVAIALHRAQWPYDGVREQRPILWRSTRSRAPSTNTSGGVSLFEVFPDPKIISTLSQQSGAA